jgi:RNA polymerase sigma-70 factor (ECF subfamily)
MDNDYKKLRQFEGKQGCTLASWVRLLTIRQTIDFLRGSKNHVSMNDDSDGGPPMVETLSDTQVSFQEQIESAESRRALRDAIDSLPSSDALFMKLFYEKGIPSEEIATILNVTVNTVYSKKNRVREKIKNILIDQGAIARNPD